MTTIYETAAVLGIEFDSPLGHMDMRGRWVEIGSLVLPSEGGIRVVPRCGVDEDNRVKLLSKAVEVALHGRGEPPIWRFDERIGWVACVKVRHWPPRRKQEREFALEILTAYGRNPKEARLHQSFYVDLGRRCSLSAAEIGECLGLSVNEVCRELAAGGQ
ncbi:hypothetical protein IU448_15110 [Nocardia flavorosea]|uniref:hypothetical protein n=1 Tax=Nocardia flavorosea TaxID=53429 RepID=UPI001894DB0B|nr:hypothetical protein [Nocardia flavorosea]MBF6350335.1 hypothetical protein [Nocardia flavorosea]